MKFAREAVLAALVVALTAAAVHRNSAWHTLLSMWTDCAAKSPGKSRTHNNLGNCYRLLGSHFSAIPEYQKAVELEKGNMEAQYNLAVTLDTFGYVNRAMQPYEVFCRFAPPTYAAQKEHACERLQELLREAKGTGGAGVNR